LEVVGRVNFRLEVPYDAGGVSGMAEKMVIEGHVRWSEGDAVHYGGLEVRRGEEESWEELGDLLAEGFVKVGEREEGWRGWLGPADLGRLRITVERVGE
jgi:hypothetical protein